MFGISTFAGKPFSTTANYLSLDVTENSSLADSQVFAAQFAASQTENSTLADSSTQTSALGQE